MPAVAFLVAAATIAAYLISQLALPAPSDVGRVSELIAANAVENLDLSESTLTVTEKNGDVLRVEAVTADQFDQLATAAAGAGVPVHASSGPRMSWLSSAGFLATLLLPVLVIGGVLLLIVRFVRRPPRIRYAG